MALLAAFWVVPAAWGAPPPAEHFARLPSFSGLVPSPSGARLALLAAGNDGRQRLVVMDLDPLGPPRVVAGFGDADVQVVRWVNDNRLVFEAFQPGAEIREGGGGVFSVNHDGSGQVQLIAWRWSTSSGAGSHVASRVLPYGWHFHSTIDDGSNDVFVYREVRDSTGDPTEIVLARLDTSTRELRSLGHDMPDGTQRWHLDSRHEPRVVTAWRDGRKHVHWREKHRGPWKLVASFDPLGAGAFSPWHVDDAGKMLVLASRDGYTGIHRLDPASGAIDPAPLLGVKGYDLVPAREVDSRSGELLGVHFSADRPMSYWFDESLDVIQRSVDAALPAGRFNQLLCGRCKTSRFFVVVSSSDRQPGEYFLYDRKNTSLARITASRPWIAEESQGHRSAHRVQARDGMDIPVYVTHPPGSSRDKALPTVVLVHGGPWLRGGSLAWDATAQFLATRGYRVLEPEFRGSTGYGSKLFKAGWKQWGRAMQDDLVDTVQWARAQGLTDDKRVCVMGASYGGYASLMAPISHPGAFRCAISFAGLTDIDLMYSVHWSDISDAARTYTMPVLMGDPDKDAKALAEVSPLKRAGEIKVPVLLAYGAVDRRVPEEHAKRFIEEARRAGVALEVVPYLDEGHGFSLPANEADYLRRVERFLNKAIGPAP